MSRGAVLISTWFNGWFSNSNKKLNCNIQNCECTIMYNMGLNCGAKKAIDVVFVILKGW